MATVDEMAELLELYSRAPDLMKAGRFKEALEIFAQIRSKDPGNTGVLLQMAAAAQQLRDPPRAIGFYREFLDHNPENDQVWITLAINYLYAHNALQALSCCDKAVRMEPKNPQVWLAAAKLYGTFGKSGEAEACQKKAQMLQAAPAPDPAAGIATVTDPDRLHDMGKDFAVQGKYAEAEACLAKATGLQTGREDILTSLAGLYYLAGRYTEAVSAFDQALALRPDNAGNLCTAGLAAFETQEQEKALSYFERASAFDPEGMAVVNLMQMFKILGLPERSALCQKKIDAIKERRERGEIPAGKRQDDPFRTKVESATFVRVLHWVGEMGSAMAPVQEAYQQGRTDDAFCHLDAVIVRFPKNPFFLKMKAAMHQKSGNFEKAGNCYRKILALYPASVYFWFDWGMFCADSGASAEAARGLNEVLRLDAGHVEALVQLATIRYNEQDYHGAIPLLERALAIDPARSILWRKKGKNHFKLWQFDDAVRCFDAALERDPTDVEVWKHKGYSLRELGQDAAADACFIRAAELQVQKAQERDPDSPRTADPKETFEFIRKLGCGGFGEVDQVWDNQNRHMFAYKTYRREHQNNENVKRLFRKEAEIWIRLGSHPNIVRAYGVNTYLDQIYIVLDYIAPGPGGLNTLEAYLKQNPPGLAQTLAWAVQICDGMNYVCAKGLACHRDLKPANIMITEGREAKVTDFGLSSAFRNVPTPALPPGVSPGSSSSLSCSAVTGQWAGTPTHMAPEQFGPADRCDQRSDIYSFGIILYQMVMRGNLPFWPRIPFGPGPEARMRFFAELMRLHQSAPVPATGTALDAIIRRCCAKRPEDRYQNFLQVKTDLEKLAGDSTGAAPGSPVRPAPDIGDQAAVAHSLYSLGKYTEALEYCTKILAIDSRDYETALMQANCLNQLKRFEEAIQAYDAALALNPESPTIWLNKAICLRDQKDYPAAVACCGKAVGLDPNMTAAWFEMCMCLQQQPDTSAALAAVSRGLEANPDSEKLLLLKANILLNYERKLAEALEVFDRIIALNPANVKALNNKGLTLVALGRSEEAVALYRRAIEADPSIDEPRENLVQALMRCGRYDEAIAFCDAELKKDPGNITFARLKEVCTKQYGSTVPAEESTLSEPERKKQKALVDQADACLQKKQFGEAFRLLEEARKSEPRSLRLLGMKASLLQMMGRYAEALACCDEALAVGDEEGLHMIRGTSLWALDRYEEALDSFALIIRKNPGNAQAHYMRGVIFEYTCRKEEGLAEYSEALRIYPEHALAREGKARLQSSSAAGPAKGSDDADLMDAIRRGRELVLSGKKKEAAAWFDDLIAKNPVIDQLWVEKGIALGAPVRVGNMTSHNPDDVHEALRCYDKAAALNPRCINAFIQQGLLYYEILDFTEAHASLDKALAIDARSISALKVKAMTFAEAARFGEAVEYCDRCLRLDGTLADIRRLREQYAAELNKHGKQEPLPGINFHKQFPESKKAQQPSFVPSQAQNAAPAPVVQNLAAELDTFHNRFARCCGRANDGRVLVEPDCLKELVEENPDRARQYMTWCCSDPAIPVRSLELVSSIGMVIQLVYGDSGPLDRILQQLRERRGKSP